MLLSIMRSQSYVKHFSIHYTFKEDQVDKLLEIGFYLFCKETISIFQTAVHKHRTAQAHWAVTDVALYQS